MSKRTFFYKETRGIRISVRPLYLESQSAPALYHYVFAYFVRMENCSKDTVQLLSRRWLIHDSIGEENEVIGDGVVGEQPTLAPGGLHEYQSFCILKSSSGYMEGSYRFMSSDGQMFDALIPRFQLDADAPARPHIDTEDEHI